MRYLIAADGMGGHYVYRIDDRGEMWLLDKSASRWRCLVYATEADVKPIDLATGDVEEVLEWLWRQHYPLTYKALVANL